MDYSKKGRIFLGYKMIVLDLDGTLTNSKKEVSKRNIEVLQKAMQMGIIVVLASGRPTRGVMPIAEMLELEKNNGCILSFNGGRIIDVTTGECLFQMDIPEGWLEKIYHLSRKCDVGLLTYEGFDKLITEDDNPYIQLELRINQMQRVTPESITKYVTFPVPKYLLTGEPEVIEKAEPLFKQMLGENLNVFRSDPYFLEILPPKIDKAYCLEKLIEKLNISKEEVIACGDGYNDINMIKFAGLGVAMENANDQAKAVADYITLSTDNDGIAHAVAEFIFKA